MGTFGFLNVSPAGYRSPPLAVELLASVAGTSLLRVWHVLPWLAALAPLSGHTPCPPNFLPPCLPPLQYNIIHYGASIFRALAPSYMYYYWSGRSGEAWRELGAVMLSITGAEALYADLGHFSRPAIRVGAPCFSQRGQRCRIRDPQKPCRACS